jgi:hypothetical protein
LSTFFLVTWFFFFAQKWAAIEPLEIPLHSRLYVGMGSLLDCFSPARSYEGMNDETNATFGIQHFCFPSFFPP